MTTLAWWSGEMHPRLRVKIHPFPGTWVRSPEAYDPYPRAISRTSPKMMSRRGNESSEIEVDGTAMAGPFPTMENIDYRRSKR